MLTKQDRQLLLKDFKTVFATKDDLKEMEGRQDKKYATKDDLINELAPIKKDLRKVAKNLKSLTNVYDLEYTKLRKRVDRIDHHLDLSPLPEASV